jgi:hypothetical protein
MELTAGTAAPHIRDDPVAVIRELEALEANVPET